MFALAIFIGLFSYILFFLGIAGLFYKNVLVLLVSLFTILLVIYFQKNIKEVLQKLKDTKYTKLLLVVLFLVSLQVLVNLIGALGPEISFDANWYHLTFARLYLIHHTIYFIPGGLLYYSAMPKTAEQLYSAVLAFGPEFLPKVLHFLFGLATCVVLYKSARRFMSTPLAALSALVFYSNLVIGWESITGYIDLVRVFFEASALYSFVLWVESKNYKWFYLSAFLVGFALTTKLLAISSVGIFVLLGMYQLRKWKIDFSIIIARVVVYFLIAVCMPLPWFIFSYVTTNNPFYPFFSEYFTHLQNSTITLSLFNPFHVISTYWIFFTGATDPISPIYIAIIPLIFVLFRKFSFQEKIIAYFTFLGIVSWYFISNVEGARLALPYIFSFSILVGILLQKIYRQKVLYISLISFVLILSVISIGYRSMANAKFVPVILGKESEAQFLSKHLNFSFGDWYDVDGYMVQNIKPTDTVLLYGYHNLYYVDFPYIHETWVKKGDKFNYIATNVDSLPSRFSKFKLVYQNSTTNIHLYSDGGKIWTY